ncbi:FecR domain-containing protein [Romeria aff. gracilis LEGE 07310]|uniref:FecR domain-containing protein n=1 Tax=Vasconcelosia minhoensis LEGE 07310 TaxID=915328 RepID=A0A8J7AC69_9CYAN|nr:FecR family protein [Romeria gracilis]MBE9077591.1 FecR domain-containing protein [Romeria aff. gracilis LEGE 07310]
MNRHPFRRSPSTWLFSALLAAAAVLGLPSQAAAQQALTWARIDFLRNRVQLIPRGRTARTARLADVMGIGDALRTAPAARAELRFNDGSLARIGERATFRFTPNTRNFQLSNGTILLLIPPGRGRTTIQTPNAVTGIQGSGLFTRYIPETDTTIVGALPNNPQGPMVVYNQSGTEQQSLYAHQMVVVEGDRISRLYNFDLELFYETSGLTEGLNLTDPAASTGSDALDGVRQEILDALEQQPPLEGEGIIENPDFIAPPPAVSSLQNDVSPAAAPPTATPPGGDTAASASPVPEMNSREPIVAPREANPIESSARTAPAETAPDPDNDAVELLEPEAALSSADAEIDAEFPDFEDSPADQFLDTDPDPTALESPTEVPTAVDQPAQPDASITSDAPTDPGLEPEVFPADPETAENVLPRTVLENATTVPDSTTDPSSVSPVETGIPSETLTEAPMPSEAMPPAEPPPAESPPAEPPPAEPPPAEPPAETPAEPTEVVPEEAPPAPPEPTQTVPEIIETPDPETVESIEEEGQPETVPPEPQ